MMTQIAQHWRMKSQRYQLAGHTCPSCQSRMFQPRHVCNTCSSTINNNQSAVIAQEEAPILVQFVKTPAAVSV